MQTSSSNNANLSIEELQKKKLRLEINELDKQWYKRKDYLQILLPTLLAIFSLAYALVSGVFSTKYELLQLREKAVEFNISRFEDKKAQLLETNNHLTTQNKSLYDSLSSQIILSDKLGTELNEKQEESSILENQLINLRTQRQDYAQEIIRLQNEFENKKQLFSGELKNEYLSNADLKNSLDEKNKEIKGLNKEIIDLKYNISLYNKFPVFSTEQKRDLNLWISREMLNHTRRQIDSFTKHSQQQHAERIVFMKQYQRLIDSIDAEMKVRKLDRKN